LPVHLHVNDAPARRPLGSARGSAMIEAALVLALGIPLLLGVTGIGLRLGRTLQATQLTRDIGHMYALGTDFTLSGSQQIASTLSRGSTLTATGNAVLILSRVVKVFQTDCTAAGLSNCPNLNQPVVAQRVVLGNAGLRSSKYGTPPAIYVDAKGNILSSDYCKQPTLIAGGFDSVLSLQQGQSAWMVEGYFSMPDLNLMGGGQDQGGGFYVRQLY
jgi:hypothetical protein